MAKKSFIILFLFFIISACSDDAHKAESGTYIGGEIVNPTSCCVLLKKNGLLLDSITLDQNHRFLYKLKNPEQGLYSFSHGEGQILYLEPGDSLLLRVNTYEFDETLTYSGFGADENNILVNFFLLNEKENDLMIQNEVYQEDPVTFASSIEVLKDQRQAELNKFLKTHEISTNFQKIAQAVIDYDFYARKEVYPLSHFGVERIQFIKSLPEKFYDYRKNANFNEADFLGLYSYQRFLINYFNQESYKEYYSDEAYNPLSFTHNVHKMRLIDTKVADDSVKSFLLTRTIKDYLANSNDKKGGETLYDMYMERIASKTDKETVQGLYDSNKKIETGKRIPDEKLISFKRDTVSFEKTIKKPAFIFFWSADRKSHAQRAQKLAQSYLEKFPEYTYMAINVKDDSITWEQTINRYDFDKSKQYLFFGEYNQIVEDLALNSMLKTFIVDQNGFILNAHTNIFSSNFENELLQGLNK